MRLPVERIKESILHPDPEVRVAAGFYFSRSHLARSVDHAAGDPGS